MILLALEILPVIVVAMLLGALAADTYRRYREEYRKLRDSLEARRNSRKSRE